jgi:NTE family protein
MTNSALRLVTAAAILSAVLVAAGCSAIKNKNDPLEQSALLPNGPTISRDGYRLAALNETGDPGVVVMVAFSGGGKRSSAFGYGVLKGLRDFKVNTELGPRRLLDELAYVSAVSGGSFPAAYYGLYRDKIFTDFEKDFLKRDIQAYIWGTYLLPWNMRWIVDPSFGTNDRMAEVYDDLMFHGARFADLQQNGRPMVSVNATDVSYGFIFPFTQDYFDLICSDLSSYRLARAVAASNGFPVLFSAITLKSYAARCGGRTPQWLQLDPTEDQLSRRRFVAEMARQYLNPDETKYVHLLDGGISDNLGLRGATNALTVLGSNRELFKRTKLLQIRRILLISADGQAPADTSAARRATLSGLAQIFNAVSGTTIDRYNFETLLLVREQAAQLAETLKKLRCQDGPIYAGHPCGDVKVTFVHLSLADIANPAIRTRLQDIPTGLTIPDEDVDLLENAGQEEVFDAPEIRQFAASLTTNISAAR